MRFRPALLFAIAVSAVTIFGTASQLRADQPRPNVLFILADDLGWSDTTLFGTTTFYKTPNIERLAARGMTFTRAYSASPLCSPTRASILTGLSPARHGITSPNCHQPEVVLTAAATERGPSNRFSTIPRSVSRLDTHYHTLAEALHDHGYATGHFGKWHLGAEPYSPLQHGFNVDVPHHPGPGPAGSYVAPWKFADFDPDPDTPDEHLEDRMAKEAVAFLEQHRDEPFFLNYWMFSVHAPFDAKPALIDAYRETVDPTSPQRSPTYAAMIESMDDAIGTLLDALDRLDLADNTIVIFASDNGGNMYNEVDGTTPTSNAPLRGGKATVYEGGIRGPAIVVQPGVTKPGSRSDQPIQSCDYYPTLLEMLALPPQPGQEFDGISIAPALRGEPLPRDAIFTYFPHNPSVPDWLPPSACVHRGDWKLIRIFYGGETGEHRYQLFNLRQDPGETQNLAEAFPQRVQDLDALLEQHLASTHAVLPLPNPDYVPGTYDLSKEGQSVPKKTGKSPQKSPRHAPPVAGWQAGGTCTLALGEDGLLVTSTGGDPHLSFTLPQPLAAAPMTLHVSMRSTSSGTGQAFWKVPGIPFAAARSVPIEVMHDGTPHAYALALTPKEAVEAIRLDPSRGPGTIEITNVRLTDAAGATLFVWKSSSHQSNDGTKPKRTSRR